MSITIYPELEAKIRERAEAEGVSVDAYVERVLPADLRPEDELQELVIQGLESGEPFEPGPDYWKRNIAASTSN